MILATRRRTIKSLSQLSIKTRIETAQWGRPGFRRHKCLSQLSIKTRIETQYLGGCRLMGTSLSQLSIKTRIETRAQRLRSYRAQVWVSYPLKQGLKRALQNFLILAVHRLSQLSIKTRIETPAGVGNSLFSPRLSQLSIKTRIETFPGRGHESSITSVWVSYPLKQGLKRNRSSTSLEITLCLSQLSIKTRIETMKARIFPHLRRLWFESAIH